MAANWNLIDKLPNVARRIDDTGDLSKFVEEVLQPALDLALAEDQRWDDQNDIDLADEKTVDLMLLDLGNPFDVSNLPLNRKKLVVRNLVNFYRRKGTVEALVDIVRAVTGVEIIAVISPASFDAWRLGFHQLGDVPPSPTPSQPSNLAVLGPSAGFIRYSFQVEVGVVLTADQRSAVTAVVQKAKPAHTHFVGFIEPIPVPPIPHWSLGLSTLWDGTSPLSGTEIKLHGP